MKKQLVVKQDGYKECGAASLLSIIRYYGGNVSMSRLLELTNTTKDGTSFYNLKIAAEEIGLDAVGYQVEKAENLFDIQNPFICQIIENNYEHFIVIYEIKKNKLICMDPAYGVRSLNIEAFSKMWTGYIMLFSIRKKLLFFKEEKYLNKIIIEIIKNNKCIVLNIIFLSIIFSSV